MLHAVWPHARSQGGGGMTLYAFDGTWNENHDTGEYGLNTNVVMFARAYGGTKRVVQKSKTEDGPSVRDDFYTEGPGTRHGWFGKVIGGAFGIGGRDRIREATEALKQRFAEGDEVIDVIGFSRGAALALHFCNAIAGLRLSHKNGESRSPTVRFLGLWDVVAAFGIPIDLGPLKFHRVNLGYKLALPENVTYCCHAIALDEQRKAFRITRVENGYEVWFRGVHSDVGGGNQNEALSNIALAWMLRKAAFAGLPVDATIAAQLAINAAAPIQPARVSIGGFRKLKITDTMHYLVDQRSGHCQCGPPGCPVESVEQEQSQLRTVTSLRERRV